jgi:protein involved in polysaccharide export with SLBB domain
MDGPPLDKALLADRTPYSPGTNLAAQYQVHCPDVLSVSVDGHPEWTGRRPVGADGEITLGGLGRLRVEGRSVPDIARAVAERAGTQEDQVRVQVAEYNSQHVLLFGEVAGLPRAVPYQGPETVLDLLRRVGGITPGAAPADVQVVRSHVAEGKTPEVFHVDLPAIVLRHEPRTNVPLQPFDQVYVGQSRRSNLSSCLPPWLRPFYEQLCGMRRSG